MATKKRNDEFLRGYACAVAMLITKDGMADRNAFELFHEGGINLDKMKEQGIDPVDIETFEKHRKELEKRNG